MTAGFDRFVADELVAAAQGAGPRGRSCLVDRERGEAIEIVL
jgi:hypothetical protein